MRYFQKSARRCGRGETVIAVACVHEKPRRLVLLRSQYSHVCSAWYIFF